MLSTSIEYIIDSYVIYFIGCMFLAAAFELQSLKQKTFKDYKPIILSIGITGTFVGIFIGLWDFDTKDITGSVPELLEGLKFAFITSIAGMLFAILLSVVENFIKKDLDDQDTPGILKAILDEQRKGNTQNDQILTVMTQSREDMSHHFKMIDESLKKALETLSKGATEEIIQALKNVISDFNRNLTEQFGENFKQLNESVKNMIVWQENYKTAIEHIENNLKKAVASIEYTSKYTKNFSEHYEKISHISKDLKRILESNENQVKNMESHLGNLKKIGEDAQIITNSISDFSKEIQNSLSEQSKGLNQLSENLTKQLDNSLNTLNHALTRLTDKFRTDYESYLNHFKELLSKLSLK